MCVLRCARICTDEQVDIFNTLLVRGGGGAVLEIGEMQK